MSPIDTKPLIGDLSVKAFVGASRTSKLTRDSATVRKIEPIILLVAHSRADRRCMKLPPERFPGASRPPGYAGDGPSVLRPGAPVGLSSAVRGWAPAFRRGSVYYHILIL